MLVILWKFRAAPGRAAEFEAAYGATGPWARLFRGAPGYVGSDLLRGADGVYLTIDRWRDEASYETFRAAQRARYDEIDSACSALTSEEVLLGRFNEPG